MVMVKKACMICGNEFVAIGQKSHKRTCGSDKCQLAMKRQKWARERVRYRDKRNLRSRIYHEKHSTGPMRPYRPAHYGSPILPLTIGGSVAVLHLPCGKRLLVDADDSDRVRAKRWSWKQEQSGQFVVACISQDCRKTIAHFITGQKWTVHRDGDGFNARRKNLWMVDKTEVHIPAKSSRETTSQFLGVTYNKQSGKWRAQISKGGRTMALGYFVTERAAAITRDRVARDLFGPTAKLNFPETGERSALVYRRNDVRL